MTLTTANGINGDGNLPRPSPDSVLGRRPQELEDNVLGQGPRKKACMQDPLIHHGRHFGRTIHAFCRIHGIINNGIIIQDELDTTGQLTKFTEDQKHHYKLFKQLLETQNVPYLKDTIFLASLERLQEISDMLHKGASGARADDTKGLKGPILEWITPKGQDSLVPPLLRNVKIDRGFYHERTGFLLCPTGLQWSDLE
ncbi:hypothetical protein DXG01_013962 [Tephrocybe rancida]|nr:hypothetical protein DXG01_013962 [Tephrocybe rancida]